MAKEKNRGYDDAYPTCADTHSTLRIFSDDLGPDDITATLRIEPTSIYRKGDLHMLGKLERKTNGWFYSTDQLTSSRDFRRHVDMILDALDGKISTVSELRARGCELDIMTYWVSKGGQGGPWLMPEQMLRLGALGISIQWDIYFSNEEEEAG